MPMVNEPAAEQSQDAGQGAPPQGGGLTQTVADVHSGLLKIMDALQAKFPEDAQKLQAVIQGYQSVIDSLGQAPGAEGPQEGPATTSPEAGAAKVQPTM